jgi:hypothetical protein
VRERGVEPSESDAVDVDHPCDLAQVRGAEPRHLATGVHVVLSVEQHQFHGKAVELSDLRQGEQDRHAGGIVEGAWGGRLAIEVGAQHQPAVRATDGGGDVHAVAGVDGTGYDEAERVARVQSPAELARDSGGREGKVRVLEYRLPVVGDRDHRSRHETVQRCADAGVLRKVEEGEHGRDELLPGQFTGEHQDDVGGWLERLQHLHPTRQYGPTTDVTRGAVGVGRHLDAATVCLHPAFARLPPPGGEAILAHVQAGGVQRVLRVFGRPAVGGRARRTGTDLIHQHLKVVLDGEAEIRHVDSWSRAPDAEGHPP